MRTAVSSPLHLLHARFSQLMTNAWCYTFILFIFVPCLNPAIKRLYREFLRGPTNFAVKQLLRLWLYPPSVPQQLRRKAKAPWVLKTHGAGGTAAHDSCRRRRILAAIETHHYVLDCAESTTAHSSRHAACVVSIGQTV